MLTIDQHLGDHVVVTGQTLQLRVGVAGGDAGVTFAWQHHNGTPVVGTSVHKIDPVTASDAGTWTVTAAKGTDAASSTATVIVLDAGDATVPTGYTWSTPFAWAAGATLALVAVAISAPLFLRAYRVMDAKPAAGPPDAAILAALIATAGIVLLAAAAFAVLVQVRGRAGTAGQVPVTVPVGSPDVARALDTLGRPRGAQLIAVAGLLVIGLSGLLAWHVADAATTQRRPTTDTPSRPVASPTVSPSTTAPPSSTTSSASETGSSIRTP